MTINDTGTQYLNRFCNPNIGEILMRFQFELLAGRTSKSTQYGYVHKYWCPASSTTTKYDASRSTAANTSGTTATTAATKQSKPHTSFTAVSFISLDEESVW
jgi:hypothetical protein